jgi:BirA family biotin operon repressor/biotin-[acetyl-CoA-carboxylase] ligase
MTPCTEWHLPTRRLGRRVLVFDRVDSTSSVAAGLAGDPANDGLAILAGTQSAGRGRQGHVWEAPPGTSVLLSLLLFPPPPLRRPAILTAWAAVAVCHTVRLVTGTPARIKWPNDVLLGGRKVCGILIEQARGTVAGIGLNVRQGAADFAAAGLPEATSLAQHAPGPVPEPAEIARLLLEQLDAEYEWLCQGDLATLEAAWKWHVGLLGRSVCAECGDGVVRGRLCDLGFDGLELEGADGRKWRLAPERVLHLSAADGSAAAGGRF